MNIKKFISEAMCCGCGACVAICPAHAIGIEVNKNGLYMPHLNESLCIDCGKCLKACPGIEVDFDDLNKRVFGLIPDDQYLGHYLSIYKGFAQDSELRHNCTSGGLVTALLSSLLDFHKIDAAVVTKYTYGDKIRTESYLARTKKDILSARGSKYAPVTLHKVIKELGTGKEKVAIICLPCHAIAIRKLMDIDSRLKENIKYIFTLFCGLSPSYKAIDYFLKKLHINAADVKEFNNRGSGWPGLTRVITKGGREIKFCSLRMWSEIFGSGYFTPLSCYCCYDFFGEFSDLSFGDAWLPECENEVNGMSVVFARTTEGQDVVREAMLNNSINLEEIDPMKVRDVFAANLRMKKTSYKIHQKLVRNCCRIIQESRNYQIELADFLREMKRLLKIRIGKYRLF